MGRRRKSQAPAAETPQITAFREAEKRYRPRTRTPTDYSDVLDLRDCAAAAVDAGAVRRAGTEAYELTDRPGLFVLPDVVAPDAQRRLAFCCYGAYHRPPAETNLTWLARRDGAEPPPRTAAPPANLRWATLGRHYDWTERTYACDHAEPMPRHIGDLCDDLCGLIGVTMNAEAAIVNYYRPGDTMGGHVDDAEEDLARPLVSLSVGCAAVLLVGGETRDAPPTALWLRSGDAVVFAGPARRAYHGVPRVLEGTCPPDLADAGRWGAGAGGDVAALCAFAAAARVNVNVRQVDAPPPGAGT